MAKRRTSKKKTPQAPAWTGPALALSIVAVLGLALGWNWLNGLPVKQIAITGQQHASAATLQQIARVSQDTLLFAIDPALVEDRLLQHPWVQEAVVRRLPPGTLAIRVAERKPVALALNRRGIPRYYLDREGHQMPADTMGAYNVPLVRGVQEPMKTAQPVTQKSLLALLAALAETTARTDALISEIDLLPGGDVDLYTTPVPGRGPIRVRLGQGGFTNKLDRLEAFWHQAVLPRAGAQFEWIDLRFDGQIVTREKA